MKRLVLVCGILAGVVSVGMGAISKEEVERIKDNCLLNGDKSACEVLISALGFISAEQCDKNSCTILGTLYYYAGRYREAIPYLKKVIAFGDDVFDVFYETLGRSYYRLQDYYNAKKYYEISCNKSYAESCSSLGKMYYEGKGVRQDYHKAHELWKKACDMDSGWACAFLGALYADGQGVRQNLYTAKKHYGKACDLGIQLGCNNYKKLNEQGVK